MLTEKPRPRVVAWFLRPHVAFRRASDWATKDHPDVAEQIHRCDELAIRASQVLSGIRRRICLQLVMTSAAHLLSFVDARAAHERARSVLKQEKDAIDATMAYYCAAANGQAQIVYFAAIAAVAVALGLFALFGELVDPSARDRPGRRLLRLHRRRRSGAVVSVVQRINSGQFNLTYDVGRPYGVSRWLAPGARRRLRARSLLRGDEWSPTVFEIPDAGTERLFTFLVIAFLAGFSERWAQDTLTALGQGSGKTDPVTSGGQRESSKSTA